MTRLTCISILALLPLFFGQPATPDSTSSAAPDVEATFLRFGRTLDRQIGTFSAKQFQMYRSAMTRFPSAMDCLDGAPDLPPEGRRLAWSRMTRLADLEVCIFNVAELLHDRFTLRRFLAANDFQNPTLSGESASLMALYGANGVGYSLAAILPEADIPPTLAGWFSRIFVYGMSIGVILSEDERPLDVRSIFLTK